MTLLVVHRLWSLHSRRPPYFSHPPSAFDPTLPLGHPRTRFPLERHPIDFETRSVLVVDPHDLGLHRHGSLRLGLDHGGHRALWLQRSAGGRVCGRCGPRGLSRWR